MERDEVLRLLRAGRKGREEWNHWRGGVGRDEAIDLTGADLKGLDLTGVLLNGIKLRSADLREADLTDASFVSASLIWADLSGANLQRTNFNSACLTEAKLRKVVAGLTPDAGANFFSADLRAADLSGAHLSLSNFGQAKLDLADIRFATLTEADFDGASLQRVRGAHFARGLSSVRVRSKDTPYFETCVRGPAERFCDWEKLRTFGRLPLFGASYSVLILTPVFLYTLALYNRSVDVLRGWAGRVRLHPDSAPMAAEIIDRLHPLPVPGQSLLLLGSTLLLAIASTIYALWCPSRVKEFSRDQWVDQLGKPLVHYWPLAWSRRWLRLICAACYVVGGLGALCVIGFKVGRAAAFIWRNSEFRIW